MIEFTPNTRYKILTPNGFQPFSGMRKTTKSEVIEISLSNGKKIQSSLDHKFIIKSKECYAKELSIGDELTPTISVINLELKRGDFILYDPTDVNNGHLFIADTVTSHNCDFLTSGHTVVEGEALKWYGENMIKDPIETRGELRDFWIWKRVDYTHDYIVSADVARGDGGDDSAIEVIDVTTMEQVAEWIGQVPPRTLGQMAVAIATEYNSALLVIENKNIGYDAVQEAIDTGYSNLYYTYRSDNYVDPAKHIAKNYDLKQKKDMVPGFTTTTANRPMIINKVERIFEQRELKMYSKRLHNQLLVFVWLRGKAQARPGRKDDAVMAIGIALFIKDTALKMKQLGLGITEKALNHVQKKVYTPQRMNNDYWTMKDPRGNTISTKWLL